MRERVSNTWDGFDGSEHVYDGKKEKSFEMRIWLVIGVCTLLLLGSLVFQQARELWLVTHGNRIQAEYWDDTMIAVAKDEEGKWRSWQLGSYDPVHQGSSITLYYWEDLTQAKPQNTLSSWLNYYFVFGGLLGLCLWRVVRIRRRYRSDKKTPAGTSVGPGES